MDTQQFDEPLAEDAERRKLFRDITSVILLLVCIFGAYIYYLLFIPPSNITYPVTLEIDQGMSVQQISKRTERTGLVRSDLILYATFTAFFDPTQIHAGLYLFEEPRSVFEVARKIASQEVDDKLITLTIPEGITVEQIADIASSVLPNFNREDYIKSNEGNEGYMFPDTYFVPESFTADDLRKLQSETFSQKVRPLEMEVSTSTLEKYRPVILASIIEREANDEESMRMVSGILRNRLDIGMALQADATIEYILDRPLSELTSAELANLLDETDSPYNSYLYPGLPPTAIGNPGLLAIDAALNPIETDYFYYLTDSEGNFHYAETLDEHNTNVQLYLR